MAYKIPEQYRMRRKDGWDSEPGDNFGTFQIPPSLVTKRPALLCIASSGGGWEQVSVSTPTRCPTWQEMCFVKSLFWNDEDCVMQLHPPQSEWVNNHPYCLHLWRPIDAEIPRPHYLMVGIKT